MRQNNQENAEQLSSNELPINKDLLQVNENDEGYFEQLLARGDIKLESSIENVNQTFISIPYRLFQQLLESEEKLLKGKIKALIEVLPKNVKQTFLNQVSISGSGNIKNALQSIFHVRDPIKLFTVSSTWHLPQQPENFTGRKGLLKQLNQYFSKLLIKNAPIVFTACHGLGGVGKSYLALKFAYDRLMSNCEIRQRTGAPTDEEKQAIVAGKLLLIICDENEQNILQLGFCDASTQSYRQEKIRDKRLLTQLMESPKKIIDLEVRQDIFKYANECGAISHYQYIFWFNAQDKDALQRDYLVLAKELGFEPVKPAEQLQNIKYWLAERSDCLLIYDNAKNFDTLRNFLPQTGPHIIVTSRYNVWPTAKVKSLNVDVFTLEESLEFIQKMLGRQRGTRQDMMNLSKTLGRLPLALIQACSYLTEVSVESIRDYLQNYQQRKKDYLSYSHTKKLTVSNLPVLITWNMTRCQISQESKLANQLLEWLTCVHHQNIPYALCLELVLLELGRTSDKKTVGQVKQLLDQALACLKKYSLIQWRPIAEQGGTLSMHILLQEVVRLQVGIKQLVKHFNRVVDAMVIVFPEKDESLAAINTKKMLLPHLEHLWTLANKHHALSIANKDKDNVSAFDRIEWLLWRLQTCYVTVGDYSKHREVLKQCLSLASYKNLYNQNCPELDLAYLNLGNVERDLGDLVQARKHYKKVLVLRKKRYGENHVELASTYENLGTIAFDLGKLEEAERHYEWAFNLFKDYYGEAHEELAGTYLNLGNVAKKRGHLEQATKYYNRALELNKKRYGEAHPALAGTYRNLGNLARQLGDLEQAEKHCKDALALSKTLYGDDHPALASIYLNLGTVSFDLFRLNEAEVYYKQALALFEKRYGKDHPELALTYLNLGSVASQQGKLEWAKQHYEHALKLQKKRYGENNTELAATYHNLGEVTSKFGDSKQARKHYEKALALFEERYGKNHPELALTYLNLGIVAFNLGKLEEAKKLYERVLALFKLFKKRHGKNHPELVVIYDCLGKLARQLGQLDQAQQYYKQALKLYIRRYHEAHPVVASVYGGLGTVFFDLGHLDNAERHHKRALMIFKKCYGDDHPELAIAHIQLGEVARQLGKLDEASDHFKCALILKRKRYGINHPALAAAYFCLGNVALNLNYLEQAKSHYERTLELQKKSCGNGRPSLAATYSNLGAVAFKSGQLKKSSEYYEQALMLFKKHYGEAQPQVLAITFNMALLSMASRNFKTALLLANRAYQQLSAHPYAGPNHSTTKRVYMVLEVVKSIYTQYELKDYSTHHEQRNYFLCQARMTNKRGITHYRNKNYPQAVVAFEESLDYFRLVATAGQSIYEEIASVKYNLGSTYLASKQATLAKYWLEKSLHLKKDKLKLSGQALDKVEQKIVRADELPFQEIERGKQQKVTFFKNTKIAILCLNKPSGLTTVLTLLLSLKLTNNKFYKQFYYNNGLRMQIIKRRILFFTEPNKSLQQTTHAQHNFTKKINLENPQI